MKSLKSLGLPNKNSPCEVSALRIDKTIQHNTTSLFLDGFKHYYSNLTASFLKKLLKPLKYSLNPAKAFQGIIQSDFFNLAAVSENTIITVLKSTKSFVAAGLDNLSGRFLEDVAKVLAKAISGLCILSVTSGKSFDSCKIAKLKPIYKNGSLTEASNYCCYFYYR